MELPASIAAVAVYKFAWTRVKGLDTTPFFISVLYTFNSEKSVRLCYSTSILKVFKTELRKAIIQTLTRVHGNLYTATAAVEEESCIKNHEREWICSQQSASCNICAF